MITPRPPVRATARVLILGTAASAACFVVGLVLAALGGDRSTGDPLRLDAILAAAGALQPWGWSMIGVLVLLATPAVGLVTSAIKLRRTQSGAALLAMAVLAILGLATIVALATS